jgi:hypothetical protein
MTYQGYNYFYLYINDCTEKSILTIVVVLCALPFAAFYHYRNGKTYRQIWISIVKISPKQFYETSLIPIDKAIIKASLYNIPILKKYQNDV